MNKVKKVISILFIIAMILVIVSTIFQIYNYLYPKEEILEETNGIWQYIMFVFPLVDIIVVSFLQVLELKKEHNNVWNRDLVFTDKYSDYIEKKNEILCSLEPTAYPEEILRQGLHLITDCLKGYIGEKYYYEVSIFTNAKEPYIYAYYDTNGNNKPSSYTMRKDNPKYYIEKKYAVIELLENPSSQIFIIPSTKEYEYNFITEQQKKQISSQIMYCFHMENPYVLVITCNKADSFKEKDLVLKNFIQKIGRILNSDILIKERICCKNGYKCKGNS